MCRRVGAGSTQNKRRRCAPGLVLWFTAAGVLAARTALGDPFGSDFAMGMLVIGAVIAVVVGIGYTAIVSVIEGSLLNRFLKLGLRQALVYSLLANFVSAAVGLLWYIAASQPGWKSALLGSSSGDAVLLFVRSFVVAVAVEGWVVMLLLRDRRKAAAVFKAVAWANVVSYVLSIPLVLVLRSWSP
jgi:hypothetical protein